MRYAFVVNRALRAIVASRKGRAVPSRASEALEMAADFLLEMRRGVAFAHDSHAKLGYSAESLPAATRAFSIIERLSLASQVSQIQELLESFESKLREMARADQSRGPSELDTLEQFLRALNQSLTEEVSQATLGSALETSENVGA